MCTLSRQLDECLGAEDALVREAWPDEVIVYHVQSDKLAPHRVVDEGGHGVDVRAECVLLVDVQKRVESGILAGLQCGVKLLGSLLVCAVEVKLLGLGLPR